MTKEDAKEDNNDSASGVAAFDVFSERGESTSSLSEFLEAHIFDQTTTDQENNNYDSEAVNRLTHKKAPTLDEQNKGAFSKALGIASSFFGDALLGGSGEATAGSLVDIARDFHDSSDMKRDGGDKDLKVFMDLLADARSQWEGVVLNSSVDGIDFFALLYYLGFEESRKTPSWKRREHRFYPTCDVETMYDLHDALYLAHMAYLHSVEDIKKALENYVGSPWELIYCDVHSQPGEPAHFLCIKREQKMPENGFKFPWQEESALDLLLVVRGTKELEDAICDALIVPEEYRDGLCHKGILQAGTYLAEKHTELLKTLLKESNRQKVRLSLIGHSLGAGAAAIAAMELSQVEFVEAKAIGFGCPALLSKELSEYTKSFVTTVVCDSDVVPRMSGPTISNFVKDLMTTPYTDSAIIDVKQLLQAIDENSPIKPSSEQKERVLDYTRQKLNESFESHEVESPDERNSVVLYPPGECIHLYRDGEGVSANYVPCTFFSEIDVSRTMISDHLIPPGYNRVMHELMRTRLNSINFTFRHDIESLPA